MAAFEAETLQESTPSVFLYDGEGEPVACVFLEPVT